MTDFEANNNKKRTAYRHRSISTLHIINVSLYIYNLFFFFLYSTFIIIVYIYLSYFLRSLYHFSSFVLIIICFCFGCSWRDIENIFSTMKCAKRGINHINIVCGKDVFCTLLFVVFCPQFPAFHCSHICNFTKDSTALLNVHPILMCFFVSWFNDYNSLLQYTVHSPYRLMTMLFFLESLYLFPVRPNQV